MQELETLVNSLIQRGWEPWNRKADFCEYRFWKIRFIKESGEIVGIYTLRSLVSLESGLWQFVCEKQLCGNERGYWLRCHSHPLDYEADYSWKFNYEFRLLESALLPEEELDKFLVENIKLEWNQTLSLETK